MFYVLLFTSDWSTFKCTNPLWFCDYYSGICMCMSVSVSVSTGQCYRGCIYLRLVNTRVCVHGCVVCLYHVVCAKLLSSPWVVCGSVKRRPDGGLAWWRTFTSHTCMHTHTRTTNTYGHTCTQRFSFCFYRSHGCMATHSWIIMIKLALIFFQSLGGTTRFVT